MTKQLQYYIIFNKKQISETLLSPTPIETDIEDNEEVTEIGTQLWDFIVPMINKSLIEKTTVKLEDDIKDLILQLGLDFKNTLIEHVTEGSFHDFLNDTFNLIENSNFYITYKDNKLKLARTTKELTNPFNIISIITEQTNEVFLTKLVDIHNKIEKLQYPSVLFENGNVFLHFNLSDNDLILHNIIDSNNIEIKSEKLNDLSKLF